VRAWSLFPQSTEPQQEEFLLLSFADRPANAGAPVYGECGGQYGVWNRFPDDPTQICQMSFVPDAIFGQGYALRLEYDVDSPNPAYNGFWLKLNGADFTQYNTLNFFIRGDDKQGYSRRLKVELKDEDNSGQYVVRGISGKWQKISIPFSKFWKIHDWTNLVELVLVFDDINSNPRVGTIYIDHITVSKE